MAGGTFLQKKFYFVVVLAVLATTIFSMFNLNSYCIVLLVACRLWDGKAVAPIRAAFSNPLFVAYLVYVLIEAAGMLHTHNVKKGSDLLAKDVTFVAIAFVLCPGNFADSIGYRRLMWAYCLLIFAASVFCLWIAFQRYPHQQPGDDPVFFYHALTSPISWNAVFFSVYVLFGLIFLLSRDCQPEGWPGQAGVGKGVRLFLVLFFLLMIVLLSSKLILVISAVVIVGYLFRRYRFNFRQNRRVAAGLGIGMVLLIGLMAVTDNPVKHRYVELAQGNLRIISQPVFNPGMYFNSLQSRLLEYRFAREVLHEHPGAWLFGVGPGDSQDLLDRKYLDANMYIGDPAQGPNRKVRGFLGYNYHNQYVETLVRDGILGLAVLLLIFRLLVVRLVRKWRTRAATLTVLTLAIFFIPEAPLTMQHGIFLFTFFPLVLFYSLKGDTPKPPEVRAARSEHSGGPATS